jgi:sugar phosphate isomerase/epimerase
MLWKMNYCLSWFLCFISHINFINLNSLILIMVEFGTGYYHPLDRDYGASSTADNSTSDVGVGIKDIGMSLPLGIAAPNVQGVAARMRTGVRKFELAFPGTGTTQRGAHTPGVYGKLQRQALEELGRANQVDFTTHAAYGVMGLAGMDQQGNFSKANKKFSVDEIKRAIEFAADVGRGGNVVVHTGEFQRPLSEADWNQEGEFAGKFQSYKEEPELAAFRVVDDRTGAIISEARKNRMVARPVWNMAKPGEEYLDSDKKKRVAREGERIYLNYEGEQVEAEERAPVYEDGKFKTKLRDWGHFKEEAKEMTERAREFWRKNEGEPEEKWRETPWYRFRKVENEGEIEIRPEEAYIIGTLETNAANARGWAYYYGGQFDEYVEKIKKLKEARKFYEKLEDATSEEEKEKLKRQADQLAMGLVPTDAKMPTEIIDRDISSYDRQIKQGQEASSAQWAQAKEAMETMRHVESSETYGLKEAYTGYAEAGIKAMQESDKLEKQGKLKQPIFIAMENIFPETYGAHPDELMDLVEGGRKQMVEMLKQKGHSESAARKEAEDHIKGHLDTGHFNIWRKYWKGAEGKTPEENDKDFDNWLLKKTEEMAKKNIIGSVHLADNYGYQDDHLSPGEGNTPVKEMVMLLRKHGYKGQLIVEPGADASTDLSDFHGVMKTWRLFGSSIYGAGTGRPSSGRSRKWQDIQYSYFGQTEPPYFVFGAYSPSEDWTLWSGVPME